jgi:hypothetical protein
MLRKDPDGALRNFYIISRAGCQKQLRPTKRKILANICGVRKNNEPIIS